MTMPTIATGLKISIANTPQAQDDFYAAGEDVSKLLNVLLNDLGGGAKSLYSLSKDLTTADGGTVTAASMLALPPVMTITTALGATATIVDGQISYVTDALDFLGAGETRVDVFSYVIRLSSGAFSIATVSVTVTGTNDVPVATAAAASVQEDGLVLGTVSATDADHDQTATLTYALVGAAPAGLTFSTNGSYSFDASSYDSLAAGEELVLTIPYKASDATSTSAPANLTITITGTNDVPVAVAASNAVDEDASVSGTVSATDADHDQTATLTYALVGDGPPGFTLHADGSYSFDASYYDWLVEGETKDLDIYFTASDPASTSVQSNLTVAITGKNDGAVIGTGAIRDVFEDEVDRVMASGTLSIDDSDAGEAQFIATTIQGTYGSLVLGESGSWTYTLDNDDPDLELLDWAEVGLEQFSISSIDGTTATLQVRVNGNDEAPVEVRVNEKADDHDFDNPAAITIFNGVIARSNNFNGGAGDDILLGDGGNQRINGNVGNDTIHGAGGDDDINGNGQDDTLYGGVGNDLINGAGGTDILYGGSGNDTLFGETASETIYGGSGDDKITGGGAGDNLWGGTGADTFIFIQPDSTISQRDTIFDFSHAEGDKIDLRAILGFATEGWLGELPDATAMLPRGLGYIDNHDGSLTIYGDHSGDGISDLAITIFGVGSLQSSDFIFA
jgi:VCBS repeat-containing protein